LLVSPPSNSHGGRCRSTNLTPASNLSESLLVSPPDKRRQKCAAEVRKIYALAGSFVDLMGQPSGRFQQTRQMSEISFFRSVAMCGCIINIENTQKT